MSGSNCCFLTHIQISQEAGKVLWYSHLLKNFPQLVVIHKVKGFGVINKAEVDGFLEFSCFFYDRMLTIWFLVSGFSTFSKSSLYIWKFSVHLLLKPSLKDFEHNLGSRWNEYSCMVDLSLLLSPHSVHRTEVWGQLTQEITPLQVEGNGTPLQCSCLENPMDGGAW